MKAIKIFCSDNGGEFTGREFEVHLKSAGTMHQTSVHSSPHQNRIAEWKNCIILKQVHAMLTGSDLLKFLWREALLHAVYMLNRMLTHPKPDGSGEATPHEITTGHAPDLGTIPEWGTKIWTQVEAANKFDVHAIRT